MKKPNEDNSTVVTTPYYSFEEIQLVYQSAETVTDRRIAMNKFNYSISIGLFIAIGFIARFMSEELLLLRYGCIFISILTVIASLFVFFWFKQIEDYKNLNSVKWELINEMTANVSFDPSLPNKSPVSYEPFKLEWERYDDLRNNPPTNTPLRLASSDMETFMPLAFGILFILAGILSIIMLCYSFNNEITSLYETTYSK